MSYNWSRLVSATTTTLLLLILITKPEPATLTTAAKSTKLWSRLNLPDEHLPYFFNLNPRLKKKCTSDDTCPFKQHLNSSICYGYEKKCAEKDQIFTVECPEDSRGWTISKTEQINMFWKQGDFGYVKERRDEMRTFCKASEPGDSSLECSKHTQFCRAKNIFFDFKNLQSRGKNDRYREDLFQRGEVGGRCQFDALEFQKEGDHKSPLQSWYSELQTFQELPFKPIDTNQCDIVVNEPTFIIKLDAGINMYHHFCDFVNLHLSQHVNNSFLQNVHIVLWDTSDSDYWSYFSDTWKVFSNKTPTHLRLYDGKKVCFRDAVFSLLARMRFGNYYNMPLVYGCHGSALYRSFSQLVVHRLGVGQKGPLRDKLRVTMLARATKFRNVLNEDKIVKALNKRLGKEIELQVVSYDIKMAFVEQLKRTHNSDVFMSMHGAGLTHLMFLPDWAAVFEIYNCEDKDCYFDLARLRGVKYFTWEDESKVYPQDEGKHPSLGTPHKKFTNYSFETREFVRIVEKMVAYVKSHPKFIEAHQRLYGTKDEL